MIDEIVLEKVRQVNLQTFIGEFVKMKRNGSSVTGLCPFHDEKSPSFSVHPTKGYKCFGCGASGTNAIDFMMAYENTSFADAVERVANISSIFIEHTTSHQYHVPKRKKPEPPPFNPTIIPDLSVKRFEINYHRSFLFAFFSARFGDGVAHQVFKTYGVGACNLFRQFSEGATTLFIQRDIQGRVRQLGACIYDPLTGKRRKEKTPEFDLRPKRIGSPHLKHSGKAEEDIFLVQCFFGEHLLKGNKKPVAIVESEKTAMIASLYYPQLVWLATGGSFGVGKPKPETWGVLKGRQVHMYPDADKLFDWIDLAAEYENLAGEEITMHDIMAGEQIPAGFEKWDLADILLAANEPIPASQTLCITNECTFHIGNRFFLPDFKGIELSTFYFSDGRIIDILFDSSEDFISETTDQVKQIEQEYKKHFLPGIIYGHPCLMHLLNH